VNSRESLLDEFMVKILCTSRVTDNNRLYILQSYIDALKAVNADAYICSYGNDTDEAASIFDGLLVTGGGDVNPDLYHAAREPATHTEPDFVDYTDIALIKSFIKANKPIFGICRGIQIINVALGGTLIQDLNTCGKDIIENYHYQSKQMPAVETGRTAHNAMFAPGSLLYSIFGSQYPVNSYHHQAVDQVADGLNVTCYSDDGIIEGFEDLARNLFAVQWHPERLIHDKKHLELFRRFINMCK
jgi:putative glutamine amidotransferase